MLANHPTRRQPSTPARMLAVLAVAVASALALSVGTAAAGSGLFGYSSPAATIIQRSIDEALDEHRAEQRASQGQEAPDPAEVDTAEADAGEADTAEADAPEPDAGEADVPEADTAESDAPETDPGETDVGESAPAPEPPIAPQPPAPTPEPPVTVPAPTPEPPATPEPPTAPEPPAEEPAPEPEAEEPADCQCLPPTDPEYLAAKAAFEAAKAAARPPIKAMEDAAASYLEAVYEFGRVRKGLRDVCGGCWDHPDVVAAQRIMNERDAVYQSLRGPAKAAANAYNAALERWDRARNLAKVNLP